MSKFKVGDRVRIVGNDACSANNIGDVGVVSEASAAWGKYRVQVKGEKDYANWSTEKDLEPAPTTRFKVGETYRTRTHGDNCKCINVNEDGSAHLAFDARTPAYVWDADGRSLSLSSEWDIVFPPVVERKTVIVSVDYKDGVPDWSTAAVAG